MTQEGEEGMDEIPGFLEDRSGRPDSWILGREGGSTGKRRWRAQAGPRSSLGSTSSQPPWLGGGGVNTGFQVSSQAPTLEWWGLGEA